MCNKQKLSKREAQGALNKIKNHNTLRFRGSKWRKEIRMYQCAECNAWHLTSMEKEDYEQHMDNERHALWTPEHSLWIKYMEG